MVESKPITDKPKRRRVVTLPALRVDVTLNTEFAQRVYKRAWDRLKGDIFILTVRSRSVGRDDIAETSEQLLRDHFDKLRKDLSTDIARTDHLMDQLAITELGQYAGAKTIAAEFTTPQAKQYLDLVLSADQLIMRLDALWLNGEIDTKACKVRSYECQRRLIKLANRIRQVSATGKKTIDAAFLARQQARARVRSDAVPIPTEPPQSDQSDTEVPIEKVEPALDAEMVPDDAPMADQGSDTEASEPAAANA